LTTRFFDAGDNPTGDEVVGVAGKGDGWWALVAADDSEFWFSLRRELPELGQRLLAVPTGRDCLRAIEDRRVKILVLDSSLSDASGTQLAHLARQIRPDLGIVLTFSQTDLEQEREARQAGILYYGDREGVREIARIIRKALVPLAAGGDPVGSEARLPNGGKAGRLPESGACTS
jgi:CheY-like chemotaxis protein